jgi:hypothetical protein
VLFWPPHVLEPRVSIAPAVVPFPPPQLPLPPPPRVKPADWPLPLHRRLVVPAAGHLEVFRILIKFHK